MEDTNKRSGLTINENDITESNMSYEAIGSA